MRKTGRSSLAGILATRLTIRHAPELLGVIISIAASTCLFGCAALPMHATLPEAARACLSQNRGFTDAWGCIQAHYAADEPAKTDLRLRTFLRLGDSLAMQVASGKLSEANARTRLAAELPDERKTIVDGVSQLVRSLRVSVPKLHHADGAGGPR